MVSGNLSSQARTALNNIGVIPVFVIPSFQALFLSLEYLYKIVFCGQSNDLIIFVTRSCVLPVDLLYCMCWQFRQPNSEEIKMNIKWMIQTDMFLKIVCFAPFAAAFIIWAWGN